MSLESAYLCRCEGVTIDEVHSAIAEGNRTINDVKRRSRAGMGICQGIFCLDQVARLLLAQGVDPADVQPMTARPPTRLVPLVTPGESGDTE